MTIPGVDYTIAYALQAALADVERFSDPDKAASYLGLVPSVRQSADSYILDGETLPCAKRWNDSLGG